MATAKTATTARRTQTVSESPHSGPRALPMATTVLRLARRAGPAAQIGNGHRLGTAADHVGDDRALRDERFARGHLLVHRVRGHVRVELRRQRLRTEAGRLERLERV